MEIKKADVDKFKPYKNNPRNNDKAIEKVAESIKNFGFRVPIIVNNENDMEIIAGHTRLEAAKVLKIESIEYITADDLTEQQIKAFRIADNKVSEYAEWDIEKLYTEIEDMREEFEDIDLSITGFDEKEIQKLIKEMNVEIIEDDFDEELPENPISKLGDVWLLGRHRLMCGDSVGGEDVKILMEGKKANMCFTDPPYNINYGNIKHPKSKQREIQNDNMSSDDFKEFCNGYTKAIKNNVLGCVYISGAPGPDGRIMFTVADELLHCSTTIIWNKDQFTLGRGKYQNKYEPIWFGWVESGSRFIDNRKLINVWDIPRPKRSDLHPTMKPIRLVSRAIEHASMQTDIILDLFGGSGSTLIATEQLDRICYMMEIDEKYVDVIIKRYANFKESTDDIKLLRNGKEYAYDEIMKESEIDG